MTVSKEQAMAMFDHDLTFVMDEIRGLLAHYHIGDWEAYLFFRKPDCPQSYVLKYEATAGGEFAQKVVALHAAPAAPSPAEPLVSDMQRELVAAGWVAETAIRWRAPDGSLWRGPYGAWKELQSRAAALRTSVEGEES